MNVKHFIAGALVGAALVTGGAAWSHGDDGGAGDGMGMMGMMSQMQDMMSKCSAMMERMHERSPGADDPGAGTDDGA